MTSVSRSSTELGPTRVVFEIPSLNAAEALALIDFCDRVASHLWTEHGEALHEQLLLDRRRPARTPSEPDLPF